MTYHVRRAGPLDARGLSELLNEIITRGGTTAFSAPVTAKELSEWMAAPHSVWHLAEDDSGRPLGFQWIARHPDLPDDIVDIASFVRIGNSAMGVGSALFALTCKAARSHGYRAIDAIILADNEGGLAYYQSRGFETLKIIKDVKLGDGTRVNKVWKRYVLKR